MWQKVIYKAGGGHWKLRANSHFLPDLQHINSHTKGHACAAFQTITGNVYGGMFYTQTHTQIAKYDSNFGH